MGLWMVTEGIGTAGGIWLGSSHLTWCLAGDRGRGMVPRGTHFHEDEDNKGDEDIRAGMAPGLGDAHVLKLLSQALLDPRPVVEEGHQGVLLRELRGRSVSQGWQLGAPRARGTSPGCLPHQPRHEMLLAQGGQGHHWGTARCAPKARGSALRYLASHELSEARREGQRGDEQGDQCGEEQAPVGAAPAAMTPAGTAAPHPGTRHHNHHGPQEPPGSDIPLPATGLPPAASNQPGQGAGLPLTPTCHQPRPWDLGGTHFFMRKRLMVFCLRMNCTILRLK